MDDVKQKLAPFTIQMLNALSCLYYCWQTVLTDDGDDDSEVRDSIY